METNNTPVNIKEFKALIERYETITLEEIKDKWVEDSWNAAQLTGFGNIMTCTLCIACKNKCNQCVYGGITSCIKSTLEKSYDRIDNSKTPKQLLNAYRARAKVLRLFAKENNINID